MPVEVNHRVEDICALEHSNRAILFPSLDYFSIKTTDRQIILVRIFLCWEFVSATTSAGFLMSSDNLNVKR
ncbi:hypothetical protein F2P79_003306 [Pimephales promelas]|nr:hypothetical protein F2P79_003306 [Pimephales promelas]